MEFLTIPDQGEGVTTDSVAGRLNDGERDGSGKCCVALGGDGSFRTIPADSGLRTSRVTAMLAAAP